MKNCTKCKIIKNDNEFYIRTDSKKLSSWCKVCLYNKSIENSKTRRIRRGDELRKYDKELYRKNKILKLLTDIKYRSKRDGIICTLKRQDIIIPKVCPILGIPIEVGHPNRDNWPSVDRIDPTKGYVCDNIIVISYKANRLKSETSSQERKSLINFYNSLTPTYCYEDNGV